MTHRKLIEQMLAVLTSPYKWGGGLEAAKQAAITAAREYLAAPEGEPVAYLRYDGKHVVLADDLKNYPKPERFNQPLYAHPAPEAKQPDPDLELSEEEKEDQDSLQRAYDTYKDRLENDQD